MARQHTLEVRLLDESYRNRQFIMVGDDAVVSHTRQRLQASDDKSGPNLKPIEDWAKFAAAVVALAYPPARVPALGIAVGYEVAKRALEAWGSVNQSIANDIPLVSMSEVRDIQFPPGHPRVDELYIGHPAAGNRYYPAWDFHRAVFEHKFSEAIRLLMALGGTRIEVHHVEGWSKEVIGTMALPIPAGSGDVQVTLKHGDSRQLLLESDLDPTWKRPFLPRGLVWYPNEPMWQAIAQGRLKHRMRTCQMVVNYEDNYGVNASLGAQIDKLKGKLKLGGKWKDHQPTIWRVRAHFGGRNWIRRLAGSEHQPA